ncbi:MAG TPA: hypothetical protein PKG80_01775 [Acidobacteriota bacterium]|nr:hypothetical protein [bacterium]HNX18979.1 hypothetical protein [Acidobacteriota bacterium]
MIGQQAALLERAEPLATVRCATHEETLRLEAEVAVQVLPLCARRGEAPVRIRFAGQTIVATPLDTRRFVRAMARFLSFN